MAHSSLGKTLIKLSFPYARGEGDELPGDARGTGVMGSVNQFEDGHDRMLAALAAVEVAERECLRAAMEQVGTLAEKAGLGQGQLLIFHTVPRSDAVRALDERDCSREDAVLQAVDLADVGGHRLRLTAAGLGPLSIAATLPEPRGATYERCAGCFPSGACGQSGPSSGSDSGQRLSCLSVPPLVGDRFWQQAVLIWIDLHRALATWVGRRLAATLVVAPESGDVGSLEPFYCPGTGQDFEVVTSLRLADEVGGFDDLETALVNVLGENDGTTPDQIELDLRRWLHGVGFDLPGFPAHGPCGCDPSTEG
jgi:hypothetical protein